MLEYRHLLQTKKMNRRAILRNAQQYLAKSCEGKKMLLVKIGKKKSKLLWMRFFYPAP